MQRGPFKSFTIVCLYWSLPAANWFISWEDKCFPLPNMLCRSELRCMFRTDSGWAAHYTGTTGCQRLWLVFSSFCLACATADTPTNLNNFMARFESLKLVTTCGVKWAPINTWSTSYSTLFLSLFITLLVLQPFGFSYPPMMWCVLSSGTVQGVLSILLW